MRSSAQAEILSLVRAALNIEAGDIARVEQLLNRGRFLYPNDQMVSRRPFFEF